MKYCTKCGNELKDTDIFCGKCGTKVEVDNNETEDFFEKRATFKNEVKKDRKDPNTYATAGFTCSFLSFGAAIFVLWFFFLFTSTGSGVDKNIVRNVTYFGIFIGLFGIGFSIPGAVKGSRTGYKKVRAILGIVLGGIALFTLLPLINVFI